MFDTIVVPLDGWEQAERALGPAEALARLSDARILLVTVYEDLPEFQNEDYLHAVQSRLAARSDTLLVPSGPPGKRIAAVAAETPSSLVCMSSQGRHGWERLVIGSVASDVVRAQVGPVMLVGPNSQPATDAYGQLVVPLDGSRFAADVVPFACTLADRFELKVHLVAVSTPAFVPSAREAGLEAPEVVEASYIADLARKLGEENVAITWEVLHDVKPARAIANYASSLPAPLLAMTTHGRSGWSEAVLGSVASDVVHASPCPVFLIRPRPIED